MQRRLTTQDIAWFLDQHRTGQLDLDPPYQRRSVWSPKERSFFLDTIFRNYPSPALFLYRSIDESGRHMYHVVDGKQRLETIILFSQGEMGLAKDFGDERLAGKKWDQLDVTQKQVFWDYVLPVELISSVDGVIVNEVFERFNRNARKLEAQEMRHARYDGWFINFVEKEAEKDEYYKLKVLSGSLARRMKDVQFVSELMLIILEEEIVGFDQLYLDKKYGEYDVPAENKPDFSEEAFLDSLRRVKSYVLEMESTNGCVSKYGKTFAHFYTLWGVVALHENQLIPAPEAAASYQTFMQSVEAYKKADKTEVVVQGPEPALIYYKNSVGATTEFPQRSSRDEALKSVLLAQK